MPDEAIELLSSPIERPLVSRLFILGGPIGLAIAILLSLWVSHARVTHAVIVQAEPQWEASERLALRVQVIPEAPQPLGPARVELAIEQGGQRVPLPALTPVEPGGLAQGSLEVPALSPGAATLHVHVEASPFPPRDEALPIEVVAEREPVAPRHVVSTSMSQYADDSDPQPEALKIDVRPVGRVLAGFDNVFLLRVTDPAGKPWSGPAAVRLLDGELGAKGNPDTPPLLWEGRTDAAGLARVRGMLSSEVLRLLVEIRRDAEPDKVAHSRKIRLVSFAGAVTLEASPVLAPPGGTLEVFAAGLSAKRPVFVDIYGPDGAWVDTFDPPVQGREPPRAWALPVGVEGIVQLEAYHFTNAPGESTAVARVLADPRGAADRASLLPGLERQRARLRLPRSDRTWDQDREQGYLDALASPSLPPAGVESARAWLLGTLPVEVRGPPTLLHSRERDLAAMRAYKRTWNIGLRIFLLGGGGLFLVAMTVLMVRSQSRDANATLKELLDLNEDADPAEIEAHVGRSRRAGLLRGFAVLTLMAVGLASAALLLENLVWEF